MALFGALALVLILLLRPMEIWPELSAFMPLELFTCVTALAIGWESYRETPPRPSLPQLTLLAMFLAWCALVTTGKLGLELGLSEMHALWLGPIFLVLVGFALSNVRRLQAMATLLVTVLALVCVVAIHQGAQPRHCLEILVEGDEVTYVPDGRECVGPRACEKDGARENTDYACERVGLFGTFSSGGRVRWRGQLGDPNELAVYVGIVLPFVVWLVPKRDPRNAGGKFRRAATVVIAGIIIGLGLWTVVLTQSRGGQIVICIVVLLIAVRRFGVRSVIATLPLLLPVVLISTRAGDEAESSTHERASILAEGLETLRANLLLGVGAAQFTEEVSVGFTAHNSYLLVATELGIPGCFLWCGLLWTSLKIPISLALEPPQELDPRLVGFAEALAISMIGLLVGVFFLSFSYKHVFLVWLGLAGALYNAARHEYPAYRIHFTRWDFGGICAFVVLALVAVRVAAAAGK